MKIKNSVLNELIITGALQSLANVGLPVDVEFKFAVFLEKLQLYIDAFNAERIRILERHSAKTADGTPVIKRNGTYDVNFGSPAFSSDFDKLLNIETEIELERFQIRKTDIPKESRNLTTLQIISLKKIIDFCD